ncbi:hypothetical protein CWC25_21315 [Pseudoalteromonas sp. S4389]|nr:hypothetical protein CWC25_21315 [Pseudoalteromonas sp. S4389]
MLCNIKFRSRGTILSDFKKRTDEKANLFLPQDVFGEFLKKAGFERPQLLFYFVKIYCLHSQKNDPIARFYPEVKARTPKF